MAVALTVTNLLSILLAGRLSDTLRNIFVIRRRFSSHCSGKSGVKPLRRPGPRKRQPVSLAG
jgi:hypothetical protein